MGVITLPHVCAKRVRELPKGSCIRLLFFKRQFALVLSYFVLPFFALCCIPTREPLWLRHRNDEYGETERCEYEKQGRRQS